MKNVLITGGTGFIGSRLAAICSGQNEQVRILGQANTPAEIQNLSRLREAGFDIMEGSVVDRETADRAVAGIDVVYHLAAAQHEAGKPDMHFYDVNVGGTRTMLEASCDADVKRFIHGSTIGVYESSREVVQDCSPTIPDNIYGITKLEAERVVRSFQDRLPIVILRISETYGPGDRRLLKLFKGIEKKRYFHIGKSDNLHHPVFVDDLADALRLAADSEAARGQTMVVPGFDIVTSKEMVTTIASSLGMRAPQLTVPLWPLYLTATAMEWTMRPLGIQPPLHRRRMHFFIKSFKFSGDLAKSALGYEPQTSFEDGIRRTTEWYRQVNWL